MMSKVSHIKKTIKYWGIYTGVREITDYLYRISLAQFVTEFSWYTETAKKYHLIVDKPDTTKYSAPLDPFKIMWVSPDEISEITRRPRPLNYREFGKVKGGDWDIRESVPFDDLYAEQSWWKFKHPTLSFENSILYQSLVNRFVNKKQWEETQIVSETEDRLIRGEVAWAQNKHELKLKCEQLDKLYELIQEQGYKTQRELHSNTTLIDNLRNEILVDIGRDGQLLHVDGRHRLAIAKILDVNKIPVVVATRHKDWMLHRDWLYTSGEYGEHPDLQEFIR